MKVDYIDHMGSDLTVVNAARVSFDKQHAEFDDEKDTRLIRYLAKHDHWTPFAHPQIQVRVTVPLFIAAQLKRHEVGKSLNEVSRRYVQSEPEFYPLVWRRRPDGSVKQGSGAEFGEMEQALHSAEAERALNACIRAYKRLLDAGVAPEQARAVLPQTLYTSWYWTASLYFYANLCRQRLDSHAQKEAYVVAQAIAKILQPLFPISWKYLMS